MTRALILEDEPLLAEQLRDKLKQLWHDLEIVGMALARLRQLRPHFG